MNDILAAYEKARFEKAAQEPATTVPSPLQGAEMTDAMRRVRDAIERSIQTEARLRREAAETAEWGRRQVSRPAEGGWVGPATLGAGALGAGAAAGHYIQKYTPRTAQIEEALQRVMEAKGEKFEPWARSVLGGRTKLNLPKGAPEMAQALQLPFWQRHPRLAWVLGRRVDPEVIEDISQTRVRGKAKKQPKIGFKTGPKAKVRKVKAKYRTSPLMAQLEKTKAGKTGRQRLLEAVTGHEAAKKGKGVFRSGAVKGGLATLAGMLALHFGPDVVRSLFSDVSPATERAQEYMVKRMQLADLIRRWRQAQFEQLSQAQEPGGVTPVPWGPYIEQFQG
jgi:hypothetical protein